MVLRSKQTFPVFHDARRRKLQARHTLTTSGTDIFNLARYKHKHQKRIRENKEVSIGQDKENVYPKPSEKQGAARSGDLAFQHIEQGDIPRCPKAIRRVEI